MKTVSSGFKPGWVGSNTGAGTNPGDGSGFVLEKDPLNPKCPHAVANWQVFLNGNFVPDTEFKFDCAVGKLLRHITKFIFHLNL